ncbi:ElyC/SanA/YdcF family protein [Gelidibacter pelagius]|uniref:YdcF family protein n=1 Tax=Gelidibacter pelagius TaxID=2819985 RepID=A0ABS3SZ24_9FLAO|nr:ElyC/SanA/YdcF family protein [Gelidibacter pelagius]MBO3100163.1 YdcF family protein [Gelidibacter pelagius]
MLYFIVWGLFAYWLKRNKHKLATLVIALGIVMFLVCSTSYVPKKLIASIESAYAPIDLQLLDRSKTYYIHVLGSGATTDSRLPASMNLNQETLVRLAEGIRILNSLDQAVLVTSAASKNRPKSQAELSKEAAMSLGVNEAKIQMLETPTTTLEEAQAFKKEFGTNKNVIIVTSALHMPRAVEIFKDQGLIVIPAPSSYDYKADGHRYNGVTLPSFSSLELMNRYHVAQLKHLYYRVFMKK